MNEPLFDRPLPTSPESERAILGGIILENELASEAVESLTENDFYMPSHKYIFTAIKTLFNDARPIDPIMIGECLSKTGVLQMCGGVSEVSNLTYGLPVIKTLKHYINNVKGKTTLRAIIKAGNKMVSEALEEEDDPDVIRERAEAAIFAINQQANAVGVEHMSEGADETLAVIESMRDNRSHITGVPSGFSALDYLTSGWQPSDLILLAARPGVGKSSLALNMMNNAVADGERVAVFFSMEMGRGQIAQRMFSSDAGVDLRHIRTGYVGMDSWDRLHASRSRLNNKRAYVDHSGGLTTAQIRSRCMKLATVHQRLDLVIIDYIGLMGSTTVGRIESRQIEVSKLSRELKTIAIELNIPIIALSQLNRQVENRSTGKPQLSDLKDSGALEADADIVLFISRPNMAEPESELDVAKHRNGPCGTVKLHFEREFTRFKEQVNV